MRSDYADFVIISGIFYKWNDLTFVCIPWYGYFPEFYMHTIEVFFQDNGGMEFTKGTFYIHVYFVCTHI